MASLKYLDPDGIINNSEKAKFNTADKLIWQGDYAGSYAILDPLTKNKDPNVQAFAHLDLGDIYHFQWDFPLGQRHYENASKLFTSQKQVRGKIFTNYRIADISLDFELNSGQRSSRQAGRLLSSSFNEARKLKDEFLIAFGHHYQGLFLIAKGKFQNAFKELEEAIRIREKIKDNKYIFSSKALLARCTAELGNYSSAKQLCIETFQEQMRLGLKGAAIRTLANIAYISERENMESISNLSGELRSVPLLTTSPFLSSFTSVNSEYRQPLVLRSRQSNYDLLS